MKFLDPVLRAAEQKAAYFVAAEIENVGVPFRMEPLARIEMLVQGAAVETRKPERIRREMCGGPVENHSDTISMKAVDQVAEVIGRSVARGRRVVTRGLVSPRTGERM